MSLVSTEGIGCMLSDVTGFSKGINGMFSSITGSNEVIVMSPVPVKG